MEVTHDDDRAEGGWRPSSVGPTAKQRTAVEQAVRRLLEALVPDRAPPRHIEPRGVQQRYRSPRGCILQGEAWAVTVSWFPSGGTDEALGELQIVSWEGVVSRPGATQRAAGGARPVAEIVLHPVETESDAWGWRTADGTVLDSAALAERCLVLLAEQAPVTALADTHSGGA